MVAAGFSPALYAGLSQPNALAKETKLRFAIASDGHYGEPGTDYHQTHDDIIKWLNGEKLPLDFVIFNGDLVHDQPERLQELKSKYLEKLHCPFYAVPGNHDHADAAVWTSAFGYPDNHSFEKEGVAFIMANTADTKGNYVCPDATYLKASLDKYRAIKTVFIVLHIPPHKWVPENTFYTECSEILQLFTQYPNIKAVFHGHDHEQDGMFYTGNKLPHFFDAHYGGSWGTNYKGYRIVEVYSDDSIRTFQVNASAVPVLSVHEIK